MWAGDEVLWERDELAQTIVLRLDSGRRTGTGTSAFGSSGSDNIEQNNERSRCALAYTKLGWAGEQFNTDDGKLESSTIYK